MDKRKIVNLINTLSIEACAHGADAGGSYDRNTEKLTQALENIKEYFELIEYDIDKIYDSQGWGSLGFVRR